MKVYLSAAFGRQKEVVQIAKYFRKAGLKITSRWLTEKPLKQLTVAHMKVRALIDRQDVRKSDVLVRFTDDLSTEFVPSRLASGARMTEVGMALERGLLVVIVGGYQNVFDYLPEVKHVSTWQEAIGYLNNLK